MRTSDVGGQWYTLDFCVVTIHIQAFDPPWYQGLFLAHSVSSLCSHEAEDSLMLASAANHLLARYFILGIEMVTTGSHMSTGHVPGYSTTGQRLQTTCPHSPELICSDLQQMT